MFSMSSLSSAKNGDSLSGTNQKISNVVQQVKILEEFLFDGYRMVCEIKDNNPDNLQTYFQVETIGHGEKIRRTTWMIKNGVRELQLINTYDGKLFSTYNSQAKTLFISSANTDHLMWSWGPEDPTVLFSHLNTHDRVGHDLYGIGLYNMVGHLKAMILDYREVGNRESKTLNRIEGPVNQIFNDSPVYTVQHDLLSSIWPTYLKKEIVERRNDAEQEDNNWKTEISRISFNEPVSIKSILPNEVEIVWMLNNRELGRKTLFLTHFGEHTPDAKYFTIDPSIANAVKELDIGEMISVK